MTASRIQSARVRGRVNRRALMIAKRIVEAITNLIPAKVKGGRSSRPSFMKSQVEPQMRHKSSQTRRDFIKSSELPNGWSGSSNLQERQARLCSLTCRPGNVPLNVSQPAFLKESRLPSVAANYEDLGLSLIIPNTAPCGSSITAKRPTSGISDGGTIAFAPSSVAFLTLESGSLTAK